MDLINFYKDFSEKNLIPYFYESISNSLSGEKLINNSAAQSNKHIKNVGYVALFPSYLEPKIKKTESKFNFYKISTHLGFLVHINQYNNFDEYFKAKLNSKRRKSLKSQLKRLEQDYDISYRFYQSKIDVSHCEFLLDKLKLMIEKRFSERGDVHSSIVNWDYYESSIYNILIEDKACFFVIYNKDEPIAISLNFLRQNIFFGAIDSYDTNYSKFSLGNLMILKKIEWCFKQSYSAFDMGYGDFKYKREWSTMVYKFQSHIFYSANSIKSKIFAFIIKNLLFFKILFKRKIITIFN